jgi:hypothetical protein
MAWTPLDNSFLQSTLVGHGPDVIAVWTLMLASKDKFHRTEITASFMARVMGVEEERVNKALEILTAEDPGSRNKEFGGRRVVNEGDGVWFIVSGEKYQHRASKASALDRQKKYDRNVAARKKNADTPEFTCEHYGCRKQASGIVDGKHVCTGHAFDVAEEASGL